MKNNEIMVIMIKLVEVNNVMKMIIKLIKDNNDWYKLIMTKLLKSNNSNNNQTFEK